jgi:trigger factor
MSVVVSTEDVGPCRKQLTIEVPPPAVEAETRRIVGEFRRRARVPGFRKGKVPVELVRQRYEREIDQEVVDRLVPRYWRQAEAEGELDILMPPQVEQVDHDPGVSLKFTATVEVRPKIEIGELGDIELPESEVDPEDAEIEKAIEDLRRQVADWVPTARAAARGDRVRGSLVLLDDDEASSGEQPVDFEVGDEQVWEELSLAAVGARPEGAVEFDRRDEPEAPQRRYKLTVEAVEERELPELDDELATKLGKFDSLDALREAVAGQLQAGKSRDRRLARERALLDEMRQRHPLALPDGVVQQEVEHMLRTYADEMARRGIDLEKAEFDWQALAERERPNAEKRVHSRLLLDAAAEREGTEVDEQEFEQVLAQLARAEGRSAGAVRQALDRSGRLGELRSRLRREKLLRRLLGEEPPVGEGDSEPEVGPAESAPIERDPVEDDLVEND